MGDAKQENRDGDKQAKPETGVTSREGDARDMSTFTMQRSVSDDAPEWLQREEVSHDLSSLAQHFDKQVCTRLSVSGSCVTFTLLVPLYVEGRARADHQLVVSLIARRLRRMSGKGRRRRKSFHR